MGKRFYLRKNIALVDFIDLDKNCLDMILSWRNHDSVRRWMYKQHIISEQEHEEFIEALKKSHTKQNFLAKRDDEHIGVISFSNLDSENIFFGIYANPFLKIAGVGRVLDEISIDYAANILKKKKLMLEVMENNISVINLHKKFGFIEVDRRIVHGFKVCVMEVVLN